MAFHYYHSNVDIKRRIKTAKQTREEEKEKKESTTRKIMV
jgi:hypothetical protein